MPSAVRARRHPAGAQHAEVEERGQAKEERVHGLARLRLDRLRRARARASEHQSAGLGERSSEERHSPRRYSLPCSQIADRGT